MKQSNIKRLFALILLMAIGLRIWGISYDLPYIYHPDESGYITRSQHIFKTGDLNPHFFNYPSLFFYINSLAYVPYYLFGKLLGVFHSPGDILPPISLAMGVTQAPMPTTVLLGRIVTLIFGIGAVLLVFTIGRQLTDNTAVGLLASFMLAVSPTNVRLNGFVTPDTFVTFFVLASFLASVLMFQHGKTLHYILTGVCVGLAASSKYNGALIVLPLLTAHFLRYGKRGLKDYRLYLALLLSGLAFLVTTPFAVLDYPKFITDLQFEAHHYSTGHAGMEGDTLQWYLNYLWKTMGPIWILAVLGILYNIFLRSKQVILLSVFPLVYFVFINRFVIRNDRTIMPITPFLLLLAAFFLVQLFDKVKVIESESAHRLLFTAVSGLIVGSLIFPLARTVKDNLQITTVNSRETARIWVDCSLPAGSKIAIESYAPFVDPTRFSVQGFGRMIDHSPDWYVDEDFEYLIFSQGMYGRFYKHPDRYSDETSQYDSYFNEFKLLKVFTDGGYEVRVYQVNEKR